MDTPTAGHALLRMAEAIDAQQWTHLAALLAPGFQARLCHTGEEFDAQGFVAFNRDYPGSWRFVTETVVDAGDTAVLRGRVSDATGATDEVHYVASFAVIDADGRLTSLEEVWAEVSAPPEAARRPGGSGSGRPTSSEDQGEG